MPICWRIARSALDGVEPEHPDLARGALPVSLEDLGGRGLAGAVRARGARTPHPGRRAGRSRARPRRRRRTCGARRPRSRVPSRRTRYQPTPNPAAVSTRFRSGSPRANRADVVDEELDDLRLPPVDVPAHVRRDRITFGIAHSGLSSGSGSSSNTSSAAPAIAARSSASTRAGSSTVRATPHVVEAGRRPHRRERARVEERRGSRASAGGRRARDPRGRARRGTPRRRRSRRSGRTARPGATRDRPPRPPCRAPARARPSRVRSGRDRPPGAGNPRAARASCRPRRPASAGRADVEDPRREREHRADHPLGDRVLEDAARVRDLDVARDELGEQQRVDAVGRRLDPAEAVRVRPRVAEPRALRAPEEQRIGAAERVGERRAVARVAQLHVGRRGIDARAADPRRPVPSTTTTGRSLTAASVPRTRRAPRGSSRRRPPPAASRGTRVRPSQLVPGSRRARSRDRAGGSRARPATRPRASSACCALNQPLPSTPPPSTPTASVMRSLRCDQGVARLAEPREPLAQLRELGVRLGDGEKRCVRSQARAPPGGRRRSVMRAPVVLRVPPAPVDQHR